MQNRSWFSDLGVSFHIGMYAFSLWLVGATVVVMAASIIYGWWLGRSRPRAYFSLMLLLTSAVVGAFRSIGWGWGGFWAGNTKDYMHFSYNGH